MGDSSKIANVSRDLMLISSKLGINFYLASPREYRVEEEFLKQVYKNAELSGSEITIAKGPKEAIALSDFIYTDVWTWAGVEKDKEEVARRLRTLRPYQVNSELMKVAPSHCKFMHCLPAKRGNEVTNEVIDSKQSLVFDQAENRLHTEVALLITFIVKGAALAAMGRESR